MHASTMPKYLIVVVGPTAIGKTARCVQLARHFHTEVISADARQFYQGTAIGTAQPSVAEMQHIPHHFLRFLPIQATYSAGTFAEDALKLIERLFKTYHHLILTGGSGLYIQAVCEGLDQMPPIDPMLREELNTLHKKEGIVALANRLLHMDPVYYAQVDRANPRRVTRALEVCITTGQPYTRWREKRPTPRPFTPIKIGLMCDPTILKQRIDQRVDRMMEQGLLQEAKQLYPYQTCNALRTIGYTELFDYLAGAYSQQQAIERIKKNTKRYAKRQLTWFKRDPAIRWFHPDDGVGIMQYIQTVMTGLPQGPYS